MADKKINRDFLLKAITEKLADISEARRKLALELIVIATNRDINNTIQEFAELFGDVVNYNYEDSENIEQKKIHEIELKIKEYRESCSMCIGSN